MCIYICVCVLYTHIYVLGKNVSNFVENVIKREIYCIAKCLEFMHILFINCISNDLFKTLHMHEFQMLFTKIN